MRYVMLLALLACEGGGELGVSDGTATDGTATAGTTVTNTSTGATTDTSTDTNTGTTSTGDCSVSSTLQVTEVVDAGGLRSTDVSVEVTLSEPADLAVVCEATDDPSSSTWSRASASRRTPCSSKLCCTTPRTDVRRCQPVPRAQRLPSRLSSRRAASRMICQRWWWRPTLPMNPLPATS